MQIPGEACFSAPWVLLFLLFIRMSKAAGTSKIAGIATIAGVGSGGIVMESRAGRLVAEWSQARLVTGAMDEINDLAVQPLSGQVDRGDLLSPVPQFLADRNPGLPVHLALRRRQFLGPWSTGCRCRPSGEFLVADLGVLVPVSMDAVDASCCELMLDAPQLIDIPMVGRDEAAPAGK